MTLSELKNEFKSNLDQIYSDRELDQLFYIFSEEFLGTKKVDALLEPQKVIVKPNDWGPSVERLIGGEPYQYILGKALFRNLELMVNHHVLIPRPETEELVGLLIKEDLDSPRIIDVGTGSGCIALSLKQEIETSEVVGIDVSKGAVEIARRNSQELKLDVRFETSSMEKDLSEYGVFDAIVSNPPYIGLDEKETLSKRVLSYEPDLALFSANSDPLYFYKELNLRAQEILVEDGLMFLEINEGLAESTSSVYKDYSSVEILKDMQGKSRFLKIVK